MGLAETVILFSILLFLFWSPSLHREPPEDVREGYLDAIREDYASGKLDDVEMEDWIEQALWGVPYPPPNPNVITDEPGQVFPAGPGLMVEDGWLREVPAKYMPGTKAETMEQIYNRLPYNR